MGQTFVRQVTVMKNRNAPLKIGASVLLLLLGGAILVAGQPRRPQGAPLPMSKKENGVHGVYNLTRGETRAPTGRVMVYNFRAVEDGVLYRGSGFLPNMAVRDGNGKTRVKPAGYADGKLFKFMRSKNIRHIVSLRERSDKSPEKMNAKEKKQEEDFYAEEGYFKYWGDKTGYRITVQAVPVRNGHAYDLSPPEGLHAASKVLRLMDVRRKNKAPGAVYIHCDAGKDRTGVVAAAYELRRNQGRMSRDELWRQVMHRYLLSNTLIERDKEAALLAGGKHGCGPREAPGFVCSNWLEPLRQPLERLAQLKSG